MEQQKKCPACGEALAPGTAQCPNCQLEGLDQIFLSRADYDNWVSKVLKPHMRQLSPRLYSDSDTLLILTGDGVLYGMGHNFADCFLDGGDDYIREPVHIASSVVSASVCGKFCTRPYIIYATKDGKIHIRGRGEFADRVLEFTDVREVFVSFNQFFVVNRQGQVFVFGHNLDGCFEPEREEVLKVFPEMSVKKGPFYDSNRCPSSRHLEYAERDVRRMVMETKEYQAYAQRYGQANLHILLELVSTACCDTEFSYIGYDQIYRFIPTLVWRNTYLYTPILSDLIYDNDQHPLEAHPQIKKAFEIYHNSGSYLGLCHDGTLVWVDSENTLHRLDWPNAPVRDLANGPFFKSATVSCWDGRLYLLDTSKLPEIKIAREITL